MRCLIPPRLYLDRDAFERELRSIFGSCWLFAGLASDVRGKREAFLARAGDASIRIEERGGALRATGARGEDWGVESVGAFVFVKAPGAPASSLREFLGAALPSVLEFGDAVGVEVDRFEGPVDADWKVLVENVLDNTHLSVVHSSSLARLELTEPVVRREGPHQRLQARFSAGVRERRAKARALDAFEARPMKSAAGYDHLYVFPNLSLSTPDGITFNVQVFQPLGPGRSLFVNHALLTRTSGPAPRPAIAEAFASHAVTLTMKTLEEDIAICEQVQAGLAEASEPGVLAGADHRIRDFHADYLRAIERSAP
jgi:phenylpropionate dioxygenase-like ring-hydroxylating dioxygenase large terminal subunit